MSWNRYVLPIAFGGIVFSTAVAQTPSAQPPVRSKTTVQGGHTSAPPVIAPGTPVGRVLIPGAKIPSTRPPIGGTTPANRREPCWQVAGVSQSVMQQRGAITRQARQEVEAVCANGSLSAAQKQERIREIHQAEHQQMEGLMTPQQHEAIRACQQQRGSGGISIGGGHVGGTAIGPCGGLPGAVNRQNLAEPAEAPPKD